MRVWLSLLGFLLVAGVAFATSYVAPDLPPADQATKNALSGLGRTATWTVAVDNGAAVNAWNAGTIPAELRTDDDALANRGKLRWLIVEHCDSTDTSEKACWRLGGSDETNPDADTPAMSCAAGALTGKVLTGEGDYDLIELRQPSTTSVIGASVPLWLRGRTATAVDVCLTAAW